MRILQAIAGDVVGGAEDFFMRFVIAMQEKGVTQHVLIRSHEQREQELRSHGVSVDSASFSRSISTPTRLKFNRLIHRFQPDIVMTWMSRASHLCPKGKFIHVARLGGYYDLKYYKNCDFLIGNTPKLLDFFEEQNFPRERSKYLWNFVKDKSDAPAFSRAQFQTPENVPLIIALGRYHDDKGFDVLIKAMAQVPKAHLWLAGQGPEETLYRNLIQEYQVGDRVHLLPWQTDVAPLFKAGDVFVCPSRIEPFGNILVEAWMYGLPVVSINSDGPRQTITHEKDGLLVDLEDVTGLASAINRVVQDKDLAKSMIEAGFVQIQEKYNKNAVISAYLAYFDEILKIGKRKK